MKKAHKGQALLEYTFLLLLVVSVFYGVYNKIKDLGAEGGILGGIIENPFSRLEGDSPRSKYRHFKIIR